MNIFNAITLGNGRFQEPNFTSIIGYFLSDSQDHGLSHAFLKEFLELIEEDFDINCDYKVNIESRYKSSEIGTNVLDLEIKIHNNTGLLEKIIIIELKIKESSVENGQLINQYQNVKEELVADEEIDAEDIIVKYVYLTPFKEGKSRYQAALDELEPALSGNDDMKHIVYVHPDDDVSSVSSCFRSVLEKESRGKICPIQEYTKHTLKGLIHFFETSKLLVGTKLLDEQFSLESINPYSPWEDNNVVVNLGAHAEYNYDGQNYLIQTGTCQREGNINETKLSRIFKIEDGDYKLLLSGLRSFYKNFMEDLLTKIDLNQERTDQNEAKRVYDFLEKHIHKYYGYHREDAKSQGSTHDLAGYFVKAKNDFDRLNR